MATKLEINDQVGFTDKTGEYLKGKITGLQFGNDKNLIQVYCWKESWNMRISCLVPPERVTKL